MTETIEAPPQLKQITHWIGGRAVAGTSGRSGAVYNPATGRQSGEVDFATVEEVDAAVQAAKAAFVEWRQWSLAKRAEVFFRIRVPNALPYLFSALKIAASTSVIGAIVGEWIGSNTGIGALIIQATYNFDSPLLYATIVVGSTFSALFFGVISLAERSMLRWHTAHKD